MSLCRTLDIMKRLPPFWGWCSEAKTQRLIETVFAIKPALAVEIGVFDGASLFPVALALKELGRGKAIGIDPWDAGSAVEGMVGEANARHVEWWTKEVKHEDVCQVAYGHVGALQVSDHCELRRTRSIAAAWTIDDGSVGLLHIDGNHTAQGCMADAQAWLPKVQSGGYIFADDLAWVDGDVLSVRRMVDWLLANGCVFVGLVGDCAILRKA